MSDEKPPKFDPRYPSGGGYSPDREMAVGAVGAVASALVPLSGPVVQALSKAIMSAPLEKRRTIWFNETFAPRPRREPVTTLDMRSQIEDAAQAALDTADRLIALLDAMEGDPDEEDGGDAEPHLGAPEGHASQIVWLRGTTRDLELDRQPEAHL